MSEFEKKTLNVILLHDFDFGMIKWKKKKKNCKKVWNSEIVICELGCRNSFEIVSIWFLEFFRNCEFGCLEIFKICALNGCLEFRKFELGCWEVFKICELWAFGILQKLWALGVWKFHKLRAWVFVILQQLWAWLFGILENLWSWKCFVYNWLLEYRGSFDT